MDTTINKQDILRAVKSYRFSKAPLVLSVFKNEKWVHLCLALTLLALPISSSAKSIFFALSLVSILSIPQYRQDSLSILSAPYIKAALSLVLLVFLGCFWSDANLHQKLFEVEKYSKYLYLPILMVGFQHQNTRDLALKAFLSAMCFICILSIAKHHCFLQ